MEVNLQQIRLELEEELRELERRKSFLTEQLSHIESVERMVSNPGPFQQGSRAPAESGEADKGKSWFRR
jgi:hypothetical protein